mgnify:CR=1 FL=1
MRILYPKEAVENLRKLQMMKLHFTDDQNIFNTKKKTYPASSPLTTQKIQPSFFASFHNHEHRPAEDKRRVVNARITASRLKTITKFLAIPLDYVRAEEQNFRFSRSVLASRPRGYPVNKPFPCEPVE